MDAPLPYLLLYMLFFSAFTFSLLFLVSLVNKNDNVSNFLRLVLGSLLLDFAKELLKAMPFSVCSHGFLVPCVLW